MFQEYLFVFKYLFFCLMVSVFLFTMSFFLVYQKPESEKLSSYECGFNPYGDASNKFEVKFYLMGILFMMFDLEIMYLYPWIVSMHECFISNHMVMFIFLIMLTMGFIFEWLKGALDRS